MQLGVGHSTYVPHVGGPALDLSTFWRGHMHTDQVDPEAVIFCLLYIYIFGAFGKSSGKNSDKR